MTIAVYPGPEFMILVKDVEGFEFSKELVDELQGKFPRWQALQFALEHNDEVALWQLLNAYKNRLAEILPEDVLEADRVSDVGPLVSRAKQAVALPLYLADLERRYFPERAKLRTEMTTPD